MSYLILSSHAKTGSRNSGDDLINKSLIDMLKKLKGEEITYDVFSYRDNQLADLTDMHQYKAVLAPALRPSVERQDQTIFPLKRPLLLDKARNHNIPVFAIGAGWGSYPGIFKQAKHQTLDQKDKAQLLYHFGQPGTAAKGWISCRDLTTEILLKNNGIQCKGTTGDCALFDVNKIGRKAKLPKVIKSIAVSLPHNQQHWEATYQLALELKNTYSCPIYLTVHGYYGEFSNIVNSNWNHNHFMIMDLSGGARNLSFYETIDVHIGFRLHAHIWFLRNRKPSLLIAEDGRGMGHLLTLNGLGYSAASKTTRQKAKEQITFTKEEMVKEKQNTPPISKAVQMFKKEQESEYPVTVGSLAKIDQLWKEKMRPLLEQLP
ncbi:polysaccharide pyruvyl transferase family protein [Halobacillus andaensis]|uniref:polysaccharide pyruvyl transferase family protein n=1 Tax=Halobacillus andaensis TaxID=1176239 RepID=UPI003D761B79